MFSCEEGVVDLHNARFLVEAGEGMPIICGWGYGGREMDWGYHGSPFPGLLGDGVSGSPGLRPLRVLRTGVNHIPEPPALRGGGDENLWVRVGLWTVSVEGVWRGRGGLGVPRVALPGLVGGWGVESPGLRPLRVLRAGVNHLPSLRLSVGERMTIICGLCLWTVSAEGVWRGGGDDFVQLVIMRYWPW